jgi:hypothetical protein
MGVKLLQGRAFAGVLRTATGQDLRLAKEIIERSSSPFYSFPDFLFPKVQARRRGQRAARIGAHSSQHAVVSSHAIVLAGR